MDQKLPYYMAYPMTLDYDDERIERMDFVSGNRKKRTALCGRRMRPYGI